MDVRMRYRKSFLIFNQEDGGYGSGQAPSGYVRIETRDGKGKLSASVQNLREEQGKLIYKLYILSSDEKGIYPAYAGIITVNRGKGELYWEFDPENVSGTGKTIDAFNTAVVLAEYPEKNNPQIICPLAAYKDKKISWRDKLKDNIYQKKDIKFLNPEAKNAQAGKEHYKEQYNEGKIKTGKENKEAEGKIPSMSASRKPAGEAAVPKPGIVKKESAGEVLSHEHEIKLPDRNERPSGHGRDEIEPEDKEEFLEHGGELPESKGHSPVDEIEPPEREAPLDEHKEEAPAQEEQAASRKEELSESKEKSHEHEGELPESKGHSPADEIEPPEREALPDEYKEEAPAQEEQAAPRKEELSESKEQSHEHEGGLPENKRHSPADEIEPPEREAPPDEYKEEAPAQEERADSREEQPPVHGEEPALQEQAMENENAGFSEGMPSSSEEYGKLLDRSLNDELYGKGNISFSGCTVAGNASCPFLAPGRNFNQCVGCIGGIVQKPAAGDESASEYNFENFKNTLGRYFEVCDPFGSKRRDYKWWKVNSPVYLNNILYQHNIRTPLLFNPVVITAHFKYRHLIAGIYTDKARTREYIVCGVPGVYGIDEKPFGDMCRWVQLEGSKPKYGAFGYWLVYIDPKTGKFLPLN